MELARLLPVVLGSASAAIALGVALANWVGLIRGLRGSGSSSPILLVGPLFAFVSGGFLARGFPLWPRSIIWFPGLSMLLLDPAALPLVAWLCWRRRDRFKA